MTLQEAHEIQRRELMSLRAENKRLQKQIAGAVTTVEVETIEKLKRHVRHLEQELQTEERRHQAAHSVWKQSESRCYDLRLENFSLKNDIQKLSEQLETWKARALIAEEEVRMLNGTKKKLEKKLNTNFENSSLPSSALPFRKKVPNSRKPSGRKQGAQTGHRPHTIERLQPTREPVYIPATADMLSNTDLYPTGKTICKQLIDIQISVNVTDFITDEYRNRSNGSRAHAPFPPGLINDVNYGPSVKAYAFLLNNYYNVSIAKTSQCISDLSKGIISLSSGTISNLSKEFSTATEKERAKIFSLLVHSDVIYSDATVSNVNGKRKNRCIYRKL